MYLLPILAVETGTKSFRSCASLSLLPLFLSLSPPSATSSSSRSSSCLLFYQIDKTQTAPFAYCSASKRHLSSPWFIRNKKKKNRSTCLGLHFCSPPSSRSKPSLRPMLYLCQELSLVWLKPKPHSVPSQPFFPIPLWMVYTFSIVYEWMLF